MYICITTVIVVLFATIIPTINVYTCTSSVHAQSVLTHINVYVPSCNV